jgi:NAD(P)-dependent dehydrogenase (short-subunit alcohol dehydrogenase family)
MKIDLAGKTVVVSDATAGIGLAIARGLATAGSKLAVTGRSEAAVKKAVAEVSATAEGFIGDPAPRRVASDWPGPSRPATSWGGRIFQE